MSDPDVVVIGAGADGPACASRLAREHGLDVLVLEAGPWHGNEKWPNPHDKPGGIASSDPDDLNGELLDQQYTMRENDANDITWGYLRVGPADHSRAPWFRDIHQNGFIWQIAAVGGTSLHYFGNHPRAYPYAINELPHWPIDYEELVPYYRLNEEVTHTQQAPTTSKEEVFFEGARRAGYDIIDGLNVTETGYRPQANAIAKPPEYLDSEYDGSFSYDEGFRGDSLVADEWMGGPTPRDAPVREKARKSSNVSWVPRALDTNENSDVGNVVIRPNSYVTNINTTEGAGTLETTGVDFSDTWGRKKGTISTDVVVLAGGCIESPRLWLNSGLPDDGWVGKGLTTHWFDWVVGIYPEDALEEITGEPTIDPYVGQNSAARFDKPGVGGLEDVGAAPGETAFTSYLFSQAGYNFDNEVDPDAPWDTRGYIVGEDLKQKMAKYHRTKTTLILTDDRPHQDNGVQVDDFFSDDHGPVPKVEWFAHPEDTERRNELARIAARIHNEAGAEHVHRTDMPPLLLHMQSSMGMGRVVDENCEAYNVNRLFIADHSALANSLGGPNPTNTGQALALRTADRIGELYF